MLTARMRGRYPEHAMASLLALLQDERRQRRVGVRAPRMCVCACVMRARCVRLGRIKELEFKLQRKSALALEMHAMVTAMWRVG